MNFCLMRKLVCIILLIGSGIHLFGQQQRKEIGGTVNYLTAQNIYARFSSTRGIEKGDTVYMVRKGVLTPVFIVEYLSTVSCAGRPLFEGVNPSDGVVAFLSDRVGEEEKVSDSAPKSLEQEPMPENEKNGSEKPVKRKQDIEGRISALSNFVFSNTENSDIQRLRYTFSLHANHLGNSRLSVESYVSFAHKIHNWDAVRYNIFNGLKIYDLSLSYELGEHSKVWAGRKINPRISNIGAIDGLQAEVGSKKIFVGAVVGYRPDYEDYGINLNLLEYGGYLGHNFQSARGSMQNTLAFFQQTNQGNIDRRFLYFQHNNSLCKNLNVFFSGELDLFQLVDNQPANQLSFTSIYFSLRYRFNPRLSVFTSFDARKNVIYYETYRSYLDQMLEDATRQGVQFRIHYRPFKMSSIGLNGAYGFRRGDVRQTENLNGFFTYQMVPWINGPVTVSLNWLQNSYMDGFIYSLRLSKEFLKGRLLTDMNLRYVDYLLTNMNLDKQQMIGEIGLQYYFTSHFSVSANYEGTFETINQYHRLYINLVQRF